MALEKTKEIMELKMGNQITQVKKIGDWQSKLCNPSFTYARPECSTNLQFT